MIDSLLRCAACGCVYVGEAALERHVSTDACKAWANVARYRRDWRRVDTRYRRALYDSTAPCVELPHWPSTVRVCREEIWAFYTRVPASGIGRVSVQRAVLAQSGIASFLWELSQAWPPRAIRQGMIGGSHKQRVQVIDVVHAHGAYAERALLSSYKLGGMPALFAMARNIAIHGVGHG